MLPYSNKAIVFLIFNLLMANSIISCKKHKDPKIISKNTKVVSKDTIHISNKQSVIDLEFDLIKLEELKSKYKDDEFYTVADDANFYVSEVNYFLKKRNLVRTVVKVNKNTVLSFDNNYFLEYKDLEYWDYIFYKTNTKPTVCSPIEFKETYLKYFKDNVADIKWIGKYDYFLDFKEKGKFIGYNLSLTKDSILFSGQGYQTNFYDLCYSKQINDTLKIYYKKSIEGTDYNKNEKSYLIKLYQKKQKYYGVSPLINEGQEVLFERE